MAEENPRVTEGVTNPKRTKLTNMQKAFSEEKVIAEPFSSWEVSWVILEHLAWRYQILLYCSPVVKSCCEVNPHDESV